MSRTRKRRMRTSATHMLSSHGSVLLLLLFVFLQDVLLPTTHAQFNEPPGKRREQTFRVEEYEISNINQHYPGQLRYYCTFRGKWSKERHPNDFPKSPSWGPPILLSHSKNWRMWTGTETVTAGVEYIAEEGFPTIMYNEFQNAGFETLQMIVGERMFNTTESQELPPINVTYTHPWLSAMTKITPSPDWFAGFSDLRTISYDTETYYNQFVVKSYVWDAGTDEGESYHSFDRDLDPQIPCMRFCVPPYIGNGGSGTQDSNVAHTPGAPPIKHPTAITKNCPDREAGRIAVPRGGQFLDYSNSYIPYAAEYECVLRVGDGEVYAGNEFHEDQIRPPLHVARPDDDFLDGISPYDQPAYDNYVESLNKEEPEEEEEWDKNLLWLLLLLLLLCCAPFCAAGGLYYLAKQRASNPDHRDQTNTDYSDPTTRDSTNVSDDAFMDEASAEFNNANQPYDYDYDGDDGYDYDERDENGYYYGDYDDDYDDGGARALMSSERVGQEVFYQDEDATGYGDGPTHEYEEFEYDDSQQQQQPASSSFGDGYRL